MTGRTGIFPRFSRQFIFISLRRSPFVVNGRLVLQRRVHAAVVVVPHVSMEVTSQLADIPESLSMDQIRLERMKE